MVRFKWLAALCAVVLVVVAGCSSDSGHDASPTTASRTAATSTMTSSPSMAKARIVKVTSQGLQARIGDVQITAPAGVAPSGSKILITSKPTNPVPEKSSTSVTANFGIRFSDGRQPAKPVTISWAVEPGSVPAAATQRSGQSAWQELPVTLHGAKASVTTSHFSWIVLTNIKKWVSKLVSGFKEYLNIGYPKPSCVGKKATAGSKTYSVTATNDSLYPCIHAAHGSAVVRLYPNAGQVYRVKGAAGLTADDNKPQIDDLASLLVVQVDHLLYGNGETVVLPGEAKRYSSLKIGKTVTATKGQAEADAGLSLLPVAAFATKILFSTFGVVLPAALEDSKALFDWSKCIRDATPVGRDPSVINTLHAAFSCAGPVVGDIKGDVPNGFSIFISLLESAAGLLAGQLQGVINQATGAAHVTFDVSSAGDAGGDATMSDLQTAQVPADCQLPAQRLVAGKTTQGSPAGGGWIATDPSKVAFADFAHLGHKQALATYACTTGAGGTWPNNLLLIDNNGKLLASINLGTDKTRQHAEVTKVSSTGEVSWDSYNAGSHVHHSARISYSGGRLVLSAQHTTYPAGAVAEEIFEALPPGNGRSSLRDPDVINARQWEALTARGTMWQIAYDQNGNACEPDSTGDASCSITSIDGAEGFMTLRANPGSAYGWKVVSVVMPGLEVR